MTIRKYVHSAEDGEKDKLDKELENNARQREMITQDTPGAKKRKLDLEGQKIEIEKRKLAQEKPSTEKASGEHQLLLVPEHKRQMKGNKAAGWTYMSPDAFLDLTVSSESERSSIMRDALPLSQYNAWAKSGDNILPPWLEIQISENDDRFPYGKVQGHEGRHRAAACIKAGVSIMPVFLIGKVSYYAQYKIYPFKDDEERSHEWRYISSSDFPEVIKAQFSSEKKILPMNKFHSLWE